MVNAVELLRTSEWSQYPRVKDLVYPKKPSHPERLIGLSRAELLGSTGGLSGVFPPEIIDRLRQSGLVLDVGCGLNAPRPEGWRCTPVGHIPNAYGVDPVFSFFPGNGFEGRTLPAYAEDLPFRDKVFNITLSVKGLGWYAGATFDPYWSIYEMVRVTRPQGMVFILLGSGGGVGIEQVSLEQNYERVINAVKRIQNEKLGQERIAEVCDYYISPPPPQINLVLK